MSDSAPTDRNTFKALLDSFGVRYDERFIEEDKSGDELIGLIGNWEVPRDRTWRITIREQDRVGGYFMFYFDAEFTEGGEFIAFGVWE